MLAEEDLPYPKHDSPHPEHHGPKTPRPERKRHDRPRYEQYGGRQAKHSRTLWVPPSHQSPMGRQAPEECGGSYSSSKRLWPKLRMVGAHNPTKIADSRLPVA